MKIPFFLVTGFLGSGKTTFLKRFLEAFADKKRIAVIQNEFAPGRLDGRELRQCGKPFELVEINRGSVFCVCLLPEFINALSGIARDVRPDAVILEATGLADPVGILQILQQGGMEKHYALARVWCVADACTFLRMESQIPRMGRQVRIADSVLINKSDLCAGGLASVESRIRELNPFCTLMVTTHCSCEMGDFFSIPGQDTAAAKNKMPGAVLEPSGRPDIGSAVIKTVRPVSMETLERFVKAESSRLLRIKGFVRISDGNGAVSVQGCFGNTRMASCKDDGGPTELILMGKDIRQDAVVEEWNFFCRETG
ncbi:GTP-binding protein [bacterium]|nr:GTP-binding protein [bacterium]